VIEASYNWILWAKKLISGILCHGTYEINHTMASHGKECNYCGKKCNKICTIEIPFEERCYYGTLYSYNMGKSGLPDTYTQNMMAEGIH